MGAEELAQSATTEFSAQTAFTPFLLKNFDRILFIHNEWSDRAAGTIAVLDQIASNESTQHLDIIVIPTSRDQGKNVDVIAANTDERTLVAIRAGDGGVSSVLSSVRKMRLANPVFVLAGGNKNDFANQVFDPYSLKHPEAALLTSSICEVRPIRVDIEPDVGDAESLDAYCYASVGITGAAAARVNDPRFKQSRLRRIPGGKYLVEHTAVVGAYLSSPPFDASSQQVVELLAANGNRMAGELHPDAELSVPGFKLIKVAGKLGGLSIVAALKSGRPTGETMYPGDVPQYRIEGGKRTLLQIDGEHRHIGNAVITLSVADTGVQVLTSLAA